MIKTQQQDAAQGLQEALMQPAFNAEQESTAPTEKASEKGEKRAKGGVSPVNGVRTPAGRPKGVRNKLTSIRDAVIEAFDEVGGAEYLVRLANGTQSDRAAFISVVNKVLPSQINANVEGGIKLELSWLATRSIGATEAQIPEQRTEVIDLERDSGGKYRIKDQDTPPAGGDAGGKGQEGAKDA